MLLNEGLQVEEIHSCLLCQARGVLVYENMRDRLFGSPGVWNFLRCPLCGLVWLNPRPILKDIDKIYVNYGTHCIEGGNSVPTKSSSARRKIKETVLASAYGYSELVQSGYDRLTGNILKSLSIIRESVGLNVMNLPASKRGRLLDVGCGNGKFLALMRDLGWDVSGVEPDAEAAKMAQKQFGVDVFEGSLEHAHLPDESVDVISLNHVSEHLFDPMATFEECIRVLRKKGLLVVVTPNIESLGHRLFNGAWMPLDPPRHFFLYSVQTLRELTNRAGLRIQELRTTARGARDSWYFSHLLKKNGDATSYNIRDYLTTGLRVEGHLFWIIEHLLIKARPNWGEEIVMIAERA